MRTRSCDSSIVVFYQQLWYQNSHPGHKKSRGKFKMESGSGHRTALSLLSLTREERKRATPHLRQRYTAMKIIQWHESRDKTVDWVPPKGCCRCGEPHYNYCEGNVCAVARGKPAIICPDCELEYGFCVECYPNSRAADSLVPPEILSSFPSGCDQCGKIVALMKCGGCGKAFYCSRHCQQVHWKKYHKKVCTQSHKK